MEHGRVVFGVFGPPNEQVPKAAEPGVGAFHDPTSGFLADFFGLNFLTSGPNVGRVAERGERFAHLFGVVARTHAQLACLQDLAQTGYRNVYYYDELRFSLLSNVPRAWRDIQRRDGRMQATR